MKKEIAIKWVEALRSGKFKKTTGHLCKVEGKTSKYCCLGVLCHIMNIPYEKDGIHKHYFADPSGLAKEAQELTGMKTRLGIFNANQLSLAKLNDSGKSFKEIANIIEDNWKTL